MDVPLAPPPAGVDEASWAAACEAVRSFCRWHVTPEIAETFTVAGQRGTLVSLPSLRVTSVTSVIDGGTAVLEPDWTPDGLLYTSRSDRRTVVVDVTHGYEDCPADVHAVLLNMVGAAVAVPAGAERLQSGPHGVTFSTAARSGASSLSEAHQVALGAYRLPSCP